MKASTKGVIKTAIISAAMAAAVVWAANHVAPVKNTIGNGI